MNKRPLQRSIIFGSILFITILCLLLGITTYREYTKALYSRYEALEVLIIVPLVSLITKKPPKEEVDASFACYEQKKSIAAKTALGD